MLNKRATAQGVGEGGRGKSRTSLTRPPSPLQKPAFGSPALPELMLNAVPKTRYPIDSPPKP